MMKHLRSILALRTQGRSMDRREYSARGSHDPDALLDPLQDTAR